MPTLTQHLEHSYHRRWRHVFAKLYDYGRRYVETRSKLEQHRLGRHLVETAAALWQLELDWQFFELCLPEQVWAAPQLYAAAMTMGKLLCERKPDTGQRVTRQLVEALDNTFGGSQHGFCEH